MLVVLSRSSYVLRIYLPIQMFEYTELRTDLVRMRNDVNFLTWPLN